MMIYRMIGLFLVVSVLLTGCHNSNGIKTQLAISAAQYLNPDINGNASPVVVSVYELKTPFEFKQANYNALSTNAASLLGTNLIDKQVFEIRPGIRQDISRYVTTSTHYLGIIAAYRNIDQAQWKSVLSLPHGASHVDIQISLESQSLIAHIDN